jgi:hypothetical protein
MIRNAVIHLQNEQPLLADLFSLPSASDVGLLCTNLRMQNGKRPVFADQIASVFLFPLVHIRFVEMPPGSLESSGADAPGLGAGAVGEVERVAAEPDLEIDEDLLRRVRDA